MRLSLLIFLGLLFSMPANAQKVLQIEKYGSAQTQKIQRGQYLTYKLKGNDSFSVGYIEDIFVEDSLLQLGDRYVNITILKHCASIAPGPVR
jgi:competence protein ComGC